MTMPQGVEHVEAALGLIRSAAEAITKLEGIAETWQTEAVSRLTATAALLRGTTDRFYLKTRVCLPFARRCEEEARKLDALLGELGVQEGGVDPAAPVAQQRLTAALEALERAARTLDERSLMQGMAIT